MPGEQRAATNCITSVTIPMHKIGKRIKPSASLCPIFHTSCVSKMFKRIILFFLLFFVGSNSIFSPPPGQFQFKVFIFLSPCRTNLTNSNRALKISLPLSTSLKFLTLSDISFSSIKLFRLVSLLTLLEGLSLFSDRRPGMVFQNNQSCCF